MSAGTVNWYLPFIEQFLNTHIPTANQITCV